MAATGTCEKYIAMLCFILYKRYKAIHLKSMIVCTSLNVNISLV